MASVKSAGFFNPKLVAGDGGAVVLYDQATQSANPTANDTLDFIIPAGFELCKAWLKVPDMDSSTGMAGKVGYLKKDTNGTITEVDDYFRAAAALGQAAAVIDLDFPPGLIFQEDVKLSITWTVAASGTFTAGTVYLTMLGNSRGTR